MEAIKTGLILFSIFVTAASALQCSPAKEARPGHTVTLSILMKPGMDVKDLTVECLHCWDEANKTYKFPLLVHRGKTLEDDNFKFLLHNKSSSGNVSFQVTLDYPGTYKFTVYDNNNKNNNCSITVTVRAALKDFTTTPPKQTGGVGNADANKQDPGAIIRGPIAAITVIATISGIIIGAIIAAFKKKRNENAEENQGTGEEMTGLRVDGDPNTPEAGASSVAESSV